MKRLDIFWKVTALLLILFFLYSFWIAPFSVYHGYFVGAAKLMAQGLVPFRDFNIMDMPLGIWLISIVYRLVGVTISGTAAVVFIMIVHLTNLFLVYTFLKKSKIGSSYCWLGVLFYVLILYSSDALMVNLEPIAVLFMLFSLFSIQLKNYISAIGWSCFFLTCSFLCCYEIIALVPAMLVFFYLEHKLQKPWLGALLYLASFACLSGLSYMLLSLFVGETSIWIHLAELNNGINDWRTILYDSIVLGGRVSLYFVLPTILLLLFKGRKNAVTKYVGIAILAFVCMCSLMVLRIRPSVCQLLYPFIVIAFTYSIEAYANRNNWLRIFFFSVVLLPGYLAVREYQKLESGDLKEIQESYISAFNEMITDKSEVALMCYQCFDYDFGPQIFSEVSSVIPYDMKNTFWGLREWNYSDHSQYVKRAMEESDFIFMNHQFANCFYSFSSFMNDDLSDKMYDYIGFHNSMALGDLNLFYNH